MPKKKPTCRKCGRVHFNFHPCEVAVERTEKQPPVQWAQKGSMDGYRPFGNIAGEGMQHLGNSANTVVKRG